MSPEIFRKPCASPLASACDSRPNFSVHRAKRDARSRARRRHHRRGRNEYFALAQAHPPRAPGARAACARCPKFSRRFAHADLILVGPGSLYTSIIPNLLVEDVADIIAHSRATCVYIANLMTQPGETRALFRCRSRARDLRAHAPAPVRLGGDQSQAGFAQILRRYEAQGAEPFSRRSRTEKHGTALRHRRSPAAARRSAPRLERLADLLLVNSSCTTRS